MHTHTYAHAYICTQTRMCIDDTAPHANASLLRPTIYAQICIHIHIHMYIHAYVRIYTCIYIHMYMSVHIHTYATQTTPAHLYWCGTFHPIHRRSGRGPRRSCFEIGFTFLPFFHRF